MTPEGIKHLIDESYNENQLIELSDWLNDKFKKQECKPPLGIILKEGALYTCSMCHSSIKTKWFGFKKLGCIQPKCSNYYKNK